MDTLLITKKQKYVICTLNNGKVNAIDKALSDELTAFFQSTEHDRSIEGVILSGRPHCFSAGLDIMKLASFDRLEMEAFWRSHLVCLQTMVGFRKPFIAAITGYAPAGATTLACTADYRIMGRGEKHVIGMHEINFSMLIPELLIRIFSHWIGPKATTESIFNAKLYHADEAKEIGLVNEACEVDEVLPRAEALMQKWTGSYAKVFAKTKDCINRDFREKLNLDMESMISDIIESSFDPIAQEHFLSFMQKIKSRNS